MILIISLWVISGGISQAPPLAMEDDSNSKVIPPTEAQEERDIPSGYAPKLASDPMFAPGANNALKNIPGTFSILLDPDYKVIHVVPFLGFKLFSVIYLGINILFWKI